MRIKKYLYKLSICIFLTLFISVLANTGMSKAEEYYNYNRNDYTIMRFPSGTIIKGILQQKISTATNNTGDKVELIVPSGMNVGDYICIPKNTKIIGEIIKLERPKEGFNGLFQILFTSMILPDHRIKPIFGHIWTKKGDGIIGGEQTDRIGSKRMLHFIEGIGDIVQIIPDGPRKIGQNTEVLPGTEWLIVLDKDLKIEVFQD